MANQCGASQVAWIKSLGQVLGSNAASLRGAAAVVRQRRDVLDRADDDARRLQARDRAFAARAGTFHADLELLDAELRRPLGTRFGRALGGKGRALAASLEARGSRRRPAQDVAVDVGNCDDGVVERGLHVGDGPRDVASNFLPLRL